MPADTKNWYAEPGTTNADGSKAWDVFAPFVDPDGSASERVLFASGLTQPIAHRIAAAPELLEACEAVLPHLNWFIEHAPVGPATFDTAFDARIKVVAAISKARGTNA